MARAVVEVVIKAGGAILGGVAAGGSKGRGKKPPPSDEEAIAGNPPGGWGGGVTPPFPLPSSLKAWLENISTNRYTDNQDDDPQDCELFPYKDREEKCKDKNAHHVIPDHCWRTTPGVGATLLALIAPETEASIAKATGQYYYPVRKDPISNEESGMDYNSGLCICVSGEGKTLKHGAIHVLTDAAEQLLGESGTPKWTTKLDTMENAAVLAVAAVTDCDPVAMKKRLREYHNDRRVTKDDAFGQRGGDSSDTMLRADPFGRNTGVGKGDPVINGRSGGRVD